MKILANEEIFPLDGISCHASHFVLLDNNDLFAVWFRGSAEGNDDVCIYGTKKKDGVWQPMRRLTEDDGQPHWNPVLFRRTDGAVLLFYKVGSPIAQWHTEVMISTDGCETWTKTKELVSGDRGGRGPVRNKILRLADGSLLAPASREDGEWRCFFDRSWDEGETWTRGRDLFLPAEDTEKYPDKTGHGLIQPTLWESAPGKIHALMRSTEGWIYRTDSCNDGTTWCDPYRTNLKNNNSGIDLDRAPNGTLWLVCNPVGTPEGSIWGKRTPLTLLVSLDNGHTFEPVTDLVTGAGTFAYPAVRFQDRMIFLTYTWNRKLIRHMCIEL